ncbi:MAG TPA: hypothetical protein PLW31_11140 [Bacteroidales bacterium]|nr:hypothetical protein [Bacteroidales bacterium]
MSDYHKSVRKSCWIILSIMISGCSQNYYVHNTVNVPAFKEKNEAQLAVSYGFSYYESYNLDVQAAHAPFNHLAYMVNYHHYWDDLGENESYQGDFVEFGPGYYKCWADEFVFETYGGVGWGWITNKFELDGENTTSKINYNRYFIQPSVSGRWDGEDWGNMFAKFSIAARFSILDYNTMRLEPENNNYSMSTIIGFASNPTYLIEPGGGLTIGWKYLSVLIQGSIPILLNNYDMKIEDSFHINVGLVGIIH